MSLSFGDRGCMKVRSHNHWFFPMKIAIAKDSKQLYRIEFADLFLFLKEYEQEHGYIVKLVFPQNMSSIGKPKGHGGMVNGNTLCGINFFMGDGWKQLKGYHHNMLMHATFDSWAWQKVFCEIKYPHFITLIFDFMTSCIMIFDIGFQPRSVEQGRKFDALYSQEMQYWRVPDKGTIYERRQQLLTAL